MGESNALLRMPRVIRRDVMQAASAIYQSEYGEEDGALPLTFRYVQSYTVSYTVSRNHRLIRATAIHGMIIVNIAIDYPATFQIIGYL